MQEFHNLMQHAGSYRRLFQDAYFDLYLWYERPEGDLAGFQLVYDKWDDPHSLTWLASGSYFHNQIDEGEVSGAVKMTPILVPDGLFDKESVADMFERASASLEKATREFVVGKLRDFDGNSLEIF